ncbi:MAG: c-type cytochrome [Alphaproteobacteria bacterium]
MMKKAFTIKTANFILAMSLITGGAGWAAAAPAAPKVPQGWTFSFPEGQVSAGKAVFLNMQCYSCHNIKGERLPFRAKTVGPDLTGYSDLSKEYLAESIIKAHTVVAAPGYTMKEGRAVMGVYNHFLTVQELIDLVAYLKHGTKIEGK